MKTISTLTLLVLASPAFGQDKPDYLDDRSTPEAVISSYYNAISRTEYARAYSYFGGNEAPDYDSWEAGYSETAYVEVSFGQSAQEGAAGSTYWTLPVKLEVTATDGRHSFYAGCYTLRLAQPTNQSPPFQPLHILAGELQTSNAQGFAPSRCN